MFKKILASILICSFLILPLKTAFAFEGEQEIPASQETQDPAEVTIPVYYFQDQYGGVLGIAPVTEDAFLWVYIFPLDSLETIEIDTSVDNATELSQNSPAGVSHVFFTGHEYDADTGLSYMNARYYNGKVGRFVSQDPAFLAVGDNTRLKEKTNLEVERYLADPQLANSYSYVANNPLKYTDSTGDFLDVALDVGFIGYDIYKMGSAAWNRNWSEVKSEAVNLGLDTGSAFIPGVTGLGMIRRAGEAAKVIKGVEKAGDVAEASKVINLNGPINITENRLQHVVDRHTIGGIDNVNASTFNRGENVTKLIKSGTQQSVTLGDRGTKFYRIFDTGRNIGIDRATGQQTSIISIITRTNGELVTAFPGRTNILR